MYSPALNVIMTLGLKGSCQNLGWGQGSGGWKKQRSDPYAQMGHLKYKTPVDRAIHGSHSRMILPSAMPRPISRAIRCQRDPSPEGTMYPVPGIPIVLLPSQDEQYCCLYAKACVRWETKP